MFARGGCWAAHTCLPQGAGAGAGTRRGTRGPPGERWPRSICIPTDTSAGSLLTERQNPKPPFCPSFPLLNAFQAKNWETLAAKRICVPRDVESMPWDTNTFFSPKIERSRENQIKLKQICKARACSFKDRNFSAGNNPKKLEPRDALLSYAPIPVSCARGAGAVSCSR